MFATNTMVLVTPAANPAGLTAFADLQQAEVTYVVCVDTAPCGKVAALLARRQRDHPRPGQPRAGRQGGARQGHRRRGGRRAGLRHRRGRRGRPGGRSCRFPDRPTGSRRTPWPPWPRPASPTWPRSSWPWSPATRASRSSPTRASGSPDVAARGRPAAAATGCWCCPASDRGGASCWCRSSTLGPQHAVGARCPSC